MSVSFDLRRILLASALLLPAVPVMSVQGQEPVPARPTQPPTSEDPAPPAGDEASTKPADPYAVPDGGVEELVSFIDGLKKYRPKNFQDFLQYRSKAPEALLAAARKILESEPAEDSEAFQVATLVILEQRIGKVGQADEKERAEVVQAVKDHVSRKAIGDLGRNEIGMVMGLARGLESADHTQEAAVVYSEFGGQFAKSSDPNIAGLGRMLEGAARRVQLLGQEMKIDGTTMAGEAFDWKSYRGKVVLVDFWATWCGPCLAEIPNVRKNYKHYHDQGFDVVGISLDRDREALEKFLAKSKLPWVTLHEKDAERNPIAEYYGVMSIPTVILVDRAGKVASLQARGPELERLLRELIGPPSKESPAEEAAAPTAQP